MTTKEELQSAERIYIIAGAEVSPFLYRFFQLDFSEEQKNSQDVIDP